MGAPAALDTYPDIILFDGVCNLCNGAVKFIIKRDKKQKFKFSSLQSDYTQALITQTNVTPTTNTIILISQSKVYDRSDAVLQIARSLSGLWPMVYFFKVIPKIVRDLLYDAVSANRYRFFGKAESCMIPTPDVKQRFI